MEIKYRNMMKKKGGLVYLIAQEIRITPRMEKLEVLIKRLGNTHPKWPETAAEYNRRMAGYRGEKSLDFHLSMLSDSKYLIFHGLRLLYRQFYFQIDILLLCSSFAMVLEVKNMTGEISFEKEFNQVTCKKMVQKKELKILFYKQSFRQKS